MAWFNHQLDEPIDPHRQDFGIGEPVEPLAIAEQVGGTFTKFPGGFTMYKGLGYHWFLVLYIYIHNYP